jgi:three-Cys-motif partner protein
MSPNVDTNPEYWLEYSNLQKVKHELIRAYLGGWFAKLGFWAGRVVYFDTHAGRGSHASGELGSPLVALDTLLGHSHLEPLLKKSEFRFFFIERDPDNLAALQEELKARTLPPRVFVEAQSGDAFALLENLVGSIRTLAPAFVFVDPYGFKVPGRILRALMAAGRVELFVNVIWRELDMAIRQGDKPGMAATLDRIFDGPEWRTRINAADFDERADQAVRLLAEKVGAKWHTYIRMKGDNGATRYLLVHFSNHDDGRDLMKDAIWKVAPDGGYFARRSTDPGQLLLITPEPDLVPLRQWVLNKLAQGPRRWQQLLADLRPELWREPHLNQVVRQLRKEGIIEPTDYTPPFSLKANPLLNLTQ